MAKKSSQKFIGRNRAPRVQIEYDVEVYGAEKAVQLPFVMGVMADLSGKPGEELPDVDQRKMLEIDVDNFDERMKAARPRVAFSVPNTMTGEGNVKVDITFEDMDDFSPAAVARKVEPLRKLLETRTQLANLLTYMDGKAGAENLMAKLLADPTLIQALAGSAAPAKSEPPADSPAADEDLGGLLDDEEEAADEPAPAEAASDDESDDLGGLLDDLDDAEDESEAEEEASDAEKEDEDDAGGDDLDDLLKDL